MINAIELTEITDRDLRSARYEASMSPLFTPASIVVVGASTSGTGAGAGFLRSLRNFGYSGRIYAVHPSAGEVLGLKAFRTLAELPEVVDYAYVATSADQAVQLIEGSQGRVRFAQVMASGFGEDSGEDTQAGANRAAMLLEAATRSGVRIVGPNCMGTHSPRGGLSFVDGASRRVGHVGVVCQSGGLGIDIIRSGEQRGLEFSGVVTVGNCVDVSIAEVLEFYTQDEDTAIIGIYVESVREGGRFFEAISAAARRKPVVLLKGGRTAAGSRAASSHTGAMMTDDRLWTGLCRQTGTVLVESLDEMLDALVAFQSLSCRSDGVTSTTVLMGNGGGASVLATDDFTRCGFDLPRLSGSTISSLKDLELPPGTGLLNPVDTPAGTLSQREGAIATEILHHIGGEPGIDAVVMHANVTVLLTNTDDPHTVLTNLARAAIVFQRTKREELHLLLVLRSDGSQPVEEAVRAIAEPARSAGIPVFPQLLNAARGLRSVRTREASLTRGSEESS